MRRMKNLTVVVVSLAAMAWVGWLSGLLSAAPTTPFAYAGFFSFSVANLEVSGDTDFDDYLVMRSGQQATINLTVSCADAGAGTVDNFVVLLRNHPEDGWHAYLSGTDWITATGNNPYSQNLASIDCATSSSASARIFVGAAQAVSFQASAGTEVVDSVVIRGSVAYE